MILVLLVQLAQMQMLLLMQQTRAATELMWSAHLEKQLQLVDAVE
jgi:hypothetical protein